MASGIPWGSVIKESGSSVAPGPPEPRYPINVKQRKTVPKKLAEKLKNGFDKPSPDSPPEDDEPQSPPNSGTIERDTW